MVGNNILSNTRLSDVQTVYVYCLILIRHLTGFWSELLLMSVSPQFLSDVQTVSIYMFLSPQED